MTNKTTETVTITQKEYDQLLEASAELNALYAYGVDNWEGYFDATQSLYCSPENDDVMVQPARNNDN